MKIAIENYRGIKAASLAVEGIALVAAKNSAGKSALAQASGAVLSGHPIPVPGVQKVLAGMLVRGGEAKGSAQLESDGDVARVDWPRSTYKTKGTPPQISAIAAGIELLAPPHSAPDDATRQKRRAEQFIELLNAQPTFEHLRARFARDGISEETARAVWDTIERQGWPAAHTQARETGARLKGQWEAVTGENYGSKKAENYIPDEWEPELAGASLDAMQAAVTDARDALDSMIAVSAVDDAERDRLQALADELPTRQEMADAAQAASTAAGQTHADALTALRALRNPASVQIHECPHCKGALSIVGGKIIAGEPISAEEAAAWEEADKTVSNVRATMDQASSQMQVVSGLLAEAKRAAEQLAGIGEGNASQDQVNAAREALRVAQYRLDAFTKKTRADKLQSSILQNASITSALDTGGVRQEVVSAAVNTFLTDSVNPLARLARWMDTEVGNDMSISYGGRAWAVLSESERYRVRVLFQVAVGVREGAQALVIDAADILDKDGRNGLIGLLRHCAIPAIVCMTYPSPSDVPDLRAAGIGESYWIRDGVLSPLAEERNG